MVINMETQIVWRDEFNIGVEVIDREHQRLFKIINKLLTFKEDKKSRQWACQEGIKFFKKHAISHFADEENYMASIGYTGIEWHKHVHKGFKENTLPALEQELEQTNYSTDAIEHFLGVCAGWLIGHTMTEDPAIIGAPIKKWENLVPSEENKAMQNAIIQLIYDMFHLESQLISDTYGGEKFGNGVYCRLIYGKKNDKKELEIFLIFEEKLLVSTVGKLMGIKSKRLDNLLFHAARYTSQQFVNCLMEHLPDWEQYELKQENLLSYEQFHKMFEREKFQTTLLFNTGAGYFSFCIIAPHFIQNNTATPITADNAIVETEKYLMKLEGHEGAVAKPKILIVDDSLTICQAMKELLDKDYDVDSVDSGVAAIRVITLNRPDLVLLDYEMPICDGRQTLEMLRSDKSFADIPVIFLTGRNDPESVKKVMSLKPAGYLLKNLNPADIKKNVDSFFEKKKG